MQEILLRVAFALSQFQGRRGILAFIVAVTAVPYVRFRLQRMHLRAAAKRCFMWRYRLRPRVHTHQKALRQARMKQTVNAALSY